MVTFIRSVLFLVLTITAAPIRAMEGDPEAGERAFRPCLTCHIAEPGADSPRAGPNLHGVLGRRAAAQEGVAYSDALRSAGAAGLVWDAETLTAYLQDPVGFLRAYLGDPTARGRMLVRVRSPQDARDILAYLSTR